MAHALDSHTGATLIDGFGRRLTYLRLSITDRCDLRCVYCMPKAMRFLPRSQLLTLEEAARLARCFAELGVTKLRVTGGEPLARRNALWLLEQLGAMEWLRDLAITTNGTQLEHYARPLKAAGVTAVNISLDSLKAARFRGLTRLGVLDKTLRGIDAAVDVGFSRVKLNAVILKDRNQDEVLDLARFAIARGVDISFIEEMPLGSPAGQARAEVYYSSDAVKSDLEKELELVPTIETTGGPSRYYRVAGESTRIGFISPHSHGFCPDCNRVRIAADGRLLLCLGQDDSADLRRLLRAHPTDDGRVKDAIRKAIARKPRGHDFGLATRPGIARHMNATGG